MNSLYEEAFARLGREMAVAVLPWNSNVSGAQNNGRAKGAMQEADDHEPTPKALEAVVAWRANWTYDLDSPVVLSCR